MNAQTKFKIGDEVLTIHNNDLRKYVIQGVVIELGDVYVSVSPNPKKSKIRYILNENKYVVSKEENEIFLTIEDLAASLFSASKLL